MDALCPSYMAETTPLDPSKRKRRRGSPSLIDHDTGGVLKALSPRHRTPLHNLEAVKRELGRVYRAVKGGAIPSDEGWRRAGILNTLARVIESSDLERRLAELEKDRQRLIPAAIGQREGAE